MRRKTSLRLMLIVVAACSAPSVRATSVDLDEFSVSPAAQRLTAGAISLTVSNSGEFPHTLVVSDANGTVIDATDLIMPGQRTTLDMNLAPGVHMFTCRIEGQSDSGEIIDHYERGMAARIDVSS